MLYEVITKAINGEFTYLANVVEDAANPDANAPAVIATDVII